MWNEGRFAIRIIRTQITIELRINFVRSHRDQSPGKPSSSADAMVRPRPDTPEATASRRELAHVNHLLWQQRRPTNGRRSENHHVLR